MTNDPLFEVDLSAFKRDIETLSTKYETALNRMVVTKAALKTAVLRGISAGLSENEASKLSGVTRKTVREWQGK